MSEIRVLLVVVAAVLLAGCAAFQEERRQETMKQAEAALDASPVCCKTFKDIDYEPLGLDKKKSATLDTSAPVFEFFTGKSRFLALKLPDAPRVLVAVTTQFYGGPFIRDSFLFDTVALVLDEDHRPISFARNLIQEYSRGIVSRAGWWGAFPIDLRKSGARYVIFFTPRAESSTAVTTSFTPSNTYVYGKTVMSSPGSTQRISTPFGKEGQLIIGFESVNCASNPQCD